MGVNSQERGRPYGNARKRLLPIGRRRIALPTRMTRAPKDRKPWPMKWIVASILVFIPIYTYLTLHYRRPGPAYNPYRDMRDRADVIRLLKAGYQRVALDASRPVEDAHELSAPMSLAPGGLPEDLRTTLVESPLLPLEVKTVSAASDAVSGIDYQIS